MKRFSGVFLCGWVALTSLLPGCGGGGGGAGNSQVKIDPQGVYKNPSATGGPQYTVIDVPPAGQLFLSDNVALVVVPESNDRVMYYTTSSGILFVAKVTATVDAVAGIGTLSGSGTAYAPTRVLGGRVSMTFANGLKAAPATINGQYVNDGTLVNGNIVIQGHETQPISVSASFDAKLDDGPVALANVVGNYRELNTENAPPRPPGTLTIDAAGRITGTDPDGSFTGTYTVVDATKNIQRVTIDYTPNGGGAIRHFSGISGVGTPNSAGQFRGLGTITVDANGQFSYGWLRQ
jgi:hypothetical protein